VDAWPPRGGPTLNDGGAEPPEAGAAIVAPRPPPRCNDRVAAAFADSRICAT